MRFQNVRVRTALFLLSSAVVIGTGLVATAGFLAAEGKEPALGTYMRANKIQDVIGFPRTDVRVMTATHVVSVYTPDDIQRSICEDNIYYIVFSPASFYLTIRHRDYLFYQLDLKPVFTYPNPYRIPARLMEGQSPAERDLVLKHDEFSRLGLFHIENSEDVCRIK